MHKLHWFFILAIGLASFSCRRHEVPEVFTIRVDAGAKGLNVHCNYPHIDGFKEAIIYRSQQPIADPGFNQPLSTALEMTKITDSFITDCADSTANPSHSKLYYKAVLYFKDRFVVSNQVEFSLDEFSVQAAANSIIPFPEINILYAYEFPSHLTLIDYAQRRVVKDMQVPNNGNIMVLYPVINEGRPELFVLAGPAIICYDALTLVQKYSIDVTGHYVRQFLVQNNFLYYLSSTFTIRVYDLNTQTLVTEMSPSYAPGCMAASLYEGKNSTLYVKYLFQRYDTQQSRYFYTSHILSMALQNGIPQTMQYQDIAALNIDSSQSGNYFSTNVSAGGNYLTCNGRGDLYDLNSYTLHRLGSIRPNLFTVNYSKNDQYLWVTQPVPPGSMTDPVTVYSLPDLTYRGSFNEHRLMSLTGVSAYGDLIDGDTLLSYQSYSNGTLAVAFKKIGN